MQSVRLSVLLAEDLRHRTGVPAGSAGRPETAAVQRCRDGRRGRALLVEFPQPPRCRDTDGLGGRSLPWPCGGATALQVVRSECVKWFGRAEQVPLPDPAAEVTDRPCLLLGLDPFGDDRYRKLVAQRADGGYQRFGGSVMR